MPDHLPDAARLRLTACAPALADPAPLLAAIGKLFAQFAREGRCTVHGAATACSGHLLLIAWEGAPLSGCAGDRLARLLAAWGGRGHDLLTAPPLVVETAAGWRAVDRAGLRALAAAGAVDGTSRLADTRQETLGGWRRDGLPHLAASWAARLLAAPLHAAPAGQRAPAWQTTPST